uniref:Secreted protein n=1 Tax=Grammatophora oceanica TaxID=210454 RepID=A0A7S1UUT1_9STRA|mmetsp:Transcript_24485/g.35962  ORF Transcript_24485/g.35962 Transcript_24485/m.35962 type:complete len:100 (+) Transcript_24485:203-502(+)
MWSDSSCVRMVFFLTTRVSVQVLVQACTKPPSNTVRIFTSSLESWDSFEEDVGESFDSNGVSAVVSFEAAALLLRWRVNSSYLCARFGFQRPMMRFCSF